MVKKYFSNPIFLSTVLCAALIYSGIVQVPGSDLVVSLIPNEKINYIQGEVKSNPSKLSDAYYSVKIKTDFVRSDFCEAKSTGNATVFIPAEYVELYYPGKLFSRIDFKVKNEILIENGAEIKMSVKYIYDKKGSGNFYVTEIHESSFAKKSFFSYKKIRALCRIQFKRLMSLWGSAGGLLLALLTGSREYLEKNVSNAFKLSGLSHILALSGMHLSLILTFAGGIERKSSLKKIGILFELFIVILFVWFAGLSPSLLRALISCILVSFSRIFNIRKRDPLIVICFTFLLHTIIAPLDLFNIAFLLSYGALLGIILFAEYFSSLFTRFILPPVAKGLSASCGANLLTLPVTLKVFGTWSPGGILSTLFVSPLITIFLYCGIIMIILSFFVPSLAVLSGGVLNFIFGIIKTAVSIGQLIPVVSI